MIRSRLLLSIVAAGTLAASAAIAADVPQKAPRVSTTVAVAPPWTGPYIGVHIGFGDYDASDRSALPTLAPAIYNGKFSGDGWLGGVQAGYDHQIGWAVIGIVADYSWGSRDGRKNVTIPFGPGINIGIPHSIEESGTVRARAGVALGDFLLYGTGGVAYAKTDASINITAGPGFAFSTSSDTDRIGWVYGAGLEWKFAQNWSAAFEYLHADYGTKNVSFGTPLGGVAVGVPVSLETDEYKLAVNYRF